VDNVQHNTVEIDKNLFSRHTHTYARTHKHIRKIDIISHFHNFKMAVHEVLDARPAYEETLELYSI